MLSMAKIRYSAIVTTAVLWINVAGGTYVAIAGTPQQSQTFTQTPAVASQPTAELPSSGLARQILKTEGLRPGFYVCLGCDDASLAVALSNKGRNLVQSLVGKEETVSRVRQAIDAAGLAARVSVRLASYDRLPHVDNMANLVVVDDVDAALKAGLSLKEIARILEPNGVAYLGGKAGLSEKTLEDVLGANEIKGAKIVRENGLWAVFGKPISKDVDEWTHFEHDAARTNISLDRAAGIPTSLQWQAGGHWPDIDFSAGANVGFASSDGRNIYWYNIVSRPTASRLICRDAYNGFLLWEKEIERQTHNGALVTIKDRIYVHLGKPGLAALDAATGEVVTQFPDAVDDKNAEHLYQDGILIQRAGGTIQAFDARTGKTLWKKTDNLMGQPEFRPDMSTKTGKWLWTKAGNVIEQDTVLVGEDKVYFLHRTGAETPLLLDCCDLRTGKSHWQKDVGALKSVVSLSLLSYRKGMILAASSPRRYRYDSPESKWAALYAISPEDGRTLWAYEYVATNHNGSAGNVFALDKAVWVKRAADKNDQTYKYAFVALDPDTGKEINKRVPSPFNRCFPDRVMGQWVLTGDMDFLNLEDGKKSGTRASRGSCGIGFMPANGLTYGFYLSCNCYNPLRGLLGFSSAPVAVPDKPQSGERLEKGPAYGAAPTEDAQPEDWPMLRHDPARSGSTPASGPAGLKVLWKAAMGGEVSGLTAADGKVFVAAIGRHSVIALL